jgi:hypothetical protein
VRVGMLVVMAPALDAPPPDICGGIMMHGEHVVARTASLNKGGGNRGGQGVRNARTRLAFAHVKGVVFFCSDIPFARSEVPFGDSLLLCVGWRHGGAWIQIWSGRLAYVNRPG